MLTKLGNCRSCLRLASRLCACSWGAFLALYVMGATFSPGIRVMWAVVLTFTTGLVIAHEIAILLRRRH
jgi:hypothetical protein